MPNTLTITPTRYEFPNSDFVWERFDIGTTKYERICGTACGHQIQFIQDFESNRIDVIIDGIVEFMKPTNELKRFIKKLIKGEIR